MTLLTGNLNKFHRQTRTSLLDDDEMKEKMGQLASQPKTEEVTQILNFVFPVHIYVFKDKAQIIFSL